MTNMRNFQTCTICNLNLILSTIALVHRQAVKVVCEVVDGTSIEVPVVVAVAVCHHVAAAVPIRLVGMIVALAAVDGVVPLIAAYLASWKTTVSTAAAAAAIVVTSIVATVAIVATIVATVDVVDVVAVAAAAAVAGPRVVALADDVVG